MSNYSFVSKILHRQFLDNNEILKLSLDNINSNSLEIDRSSKKNIFITGLARAGTTALLNSLDSTKVFASFRYKYMPFILSPKLSLFFSKFINDKSLNKIERVHQDGIFINSESPECLDEIYWKNKTYKNLNFKNSLKPHKVSQNDLRGFSFLIEKYLEIENKERFIIKNNNSHLRILDLAKFFDKSFILVIFRDPIAHSKSLLNLHLKLKKIQEKDSFILEYMNLIGHWEFGKNKKPFIYKENQKNILEELDENTIEYWLNQWIFTYEWILDIISENRENIKNIKLVCYEDLCRDIDYKNNLYSSINLNTNIDNFNFLIGKSNLSNYDSDINKITLDRAISLYSKLREISNLI